jgi:hypothetical protein
MTPEIIEQESAVFEAWYVKTYQPTPWRGRTFDKWPSGVYRLQHVQDAWQAWQARATQSEWISVEERLPETETSVLVCTERGYIFLSWASNEDVFWFYNENEDDRVTHWQPLPEPPTTTRAA